MEMIWTVNSRRRSDRRASSLLPRLLPPSPPYTQANRGLDRLPPCKPSTSSLQDLHHRLLPLPPPPTLRPTPTTAPSPPETHLPRPTEQRSTVDVPTVVPWVYSCKLSLRRRWIPDLPVDSLGTGRSLDLCSLDGLLSRRWLLFFLPLACCLLFLLIS